MAGWRQKAVTESSVWSWAEGLPLGMKEIHPHFDQRWKILC